MCILNGFPATLNSALKTKTTAYPFGIWFADANTLYVADEGDGNLADVRRSTSCRACRSGCSIASARGPCSTRCRPGLASARPIRSRATPRTRTGINLATGSPWAPVTDGLRNITGRVNGDGTVTIWGITSTVSGNGDQGADPNQLVAITDDLTKAGPTPPAGESFVTVRAAAFGEVLRGVSFTPGTFAP